MGPEHLLSKDFPGGAVAVGHSNVLRTTPSQNPKAAHFLLGRLQPREVL